VYVIGHVVIGQANTITANTRIENATIGSHNVIEASKIIDSSMGDHNHIGPYAHLRGHTKLANHSRIGNFVETKAATLHDGVKAAHLTYLGDCVVGENTNIGCGTIIANYDGKTKHITTIGKNAFIGSGSTLISPVNIADNTLIAAGSTITDDVEEGQMGIARTKQINKPGGYAAWKQKIGKS
jgi:bifunctional UDP-N-acetylglucosamine pyrophosphorylase/glucosamine-1-phosphate N-acetyltransferase